MKLEQLMTTGQLKGKDHSVTSEHNYQQCVTERDRTAAANK